MRLPHLLLWAAIAAVLAACGPRADGPSGPGTPSAGADLVSLGHACIWLGGAAVVAGVAARLWFKAELGTLAAEAGAVAIGCGCAFVWLGSHMLYLVGACVVALLAWGYHRRASLRSWLLRWFQGDPA